MWKHFSRREYVNGKFVYHKPFTKYCIMLLLAFNMSVLLLFGLGSISYYTVVFAFSPHFKEKMLSKYPDTIVKNKSTSSTYDIETSTTYHNRTSTAYDNGTSSAYDNGMFSKKYNFKMATRYSNGYRGISAVTFFVATLNILIVCCYKLFIWVKIKIIKRCAELDMSKSSIITKRRKKYLHDKILDIAVDTDAHISKLLSEENFGIFSHLNVNHPNLLIRILPRQEIHYNLKKFMFCETWEEMPGNMPPFIDIVAYMRDILNGVQYLHDCHIYHLNISPENILIVADVNNPSGIAKIANFHRATHTDKRTVENQKVGLDWIYR